MDNLFWIKHDGGKCFTAQDGEVFKKFHAVLRVGCFRMELRTEELSLHIGNGGKRNGSGGTRGGEAVRQAGHGVAVGHDDRAGFYKVVPCVFARNDLKNFRAVFFLCVFNAAA